MGAVHERRTLLAAEYVHKLSQVRVGGGRQVEESAAALEDVCQLLERVRLEVLDALGQHLSNACAAQPNNTTTATANNTLAVSNRVLAAEM
eukprot:COSAG05_NODE_3504_length_2024_cov_1.375065_5_plen_91_part_00